MPDEALYGLFGFWALEARSPALANRSDMPRKAMLFHTIASINVALGAETQMLHWLKVVLLLAGLVLTAAGIDVTGSMAR